MSHKYTRKFKGKSIIDFPTDYVVLDLETTGLSPDFDNIIEFGILKVSNGEIIDKFQSLVNPKFEISDFIEELTGITNEMLKDAPCIEEVLPKAETFIGDNIILGHNVNFDINFLYDDFMLNFEKPLKNNFIDTMRIFRKLYPELPHHRLIDMVECFGITNDEAHRALSDCICTQKCFEHMQSVVIQRYQYVEKFKSLFNIHDSFKPSTLTTDKTEFDETHPLYGKVCVFTGMLEKFSRREATLTVLNFGGKCEDNITKHTNFLILGNNDYCSTIKGGKSNKQKKAETYKLKGYDIEIIPESVFYDMIKE